MNNQLSISQISINDMDKLAAIYVRALENSDERWTDTTAHALLSNWFARQPDLAFAASCGITLVGALFLGVRPWWDGNHVVDGELFVDPKYQRQGIAQELIRTGLRTAQQKYAPVLWETYTFRNQGFPLTWYKRLGFEEIEEWVMIRADVAKVLDTLC